MGTSCLSGVHSLEIVYILCDFSRVFHSSLPSCTLWEGSIGRATTAPPWEAREGHTGPNHSGAKPLSFPDEKAPGFSALCGPVWPSSANLARRVTGFSEDDLELLWEAIINMFENDRSAARGKMAVRELIVFKHSRELGDCPAYKLFDAVEVRKKEDVEYPRKYQDYTVEVHEERIPDSVEVKRMV